MLDTTVTRPESHRPKEPAQGSRSVTAAVSTAIADSMGIEKGAVEVNEDITSIIEDCENTFLTKSTDDGPPERRARGDDVDEDEEAEYQQILEEEYDEDEGSEYSEEETEEREEDEYEEGKDIEEGTQSTTHKVLRAKSEFWKGPKPRGDLGSGPGGKPTAGSTPYDHNPEEDDVFPEKKKEQPVSPDAEDSDETLIAKQSKFISASFFIVLTNLL